MPQANVRQYVGDAAVTVDTSTMAGYMKESGMAIVQVATDTTMLRDENRDLKDQVKRLGSKVESLESKLDQILAILAGQDATRATTTEGMQATAENLAADSTIVPKMWPTRMVQVKTIQDWCFVWYADRYDLCVDSLSHITNATDNKRVKTQRSMMKMALAYFVLFFDSQVDPLPEAAQQVGRSPAATKWRAQLQEQIAVAWAKVTGFYAEHPLEKEKKAGPPEQIYAFKRWMEKIDHGLWPQGPSGDSHFGVHSRIHLVKNAAITKLAAKRRKEAKAKRQRLG